jgi:hypothetical protein
MDKFQQIIQGTSSAIQEAIVKPGFEAAGLAAENLQPMAAAAFEKAAEAVTSSAEEVRP